MNNALTVNASLATAVKFPTVVRVGRATPYPVKIAARLAALTVLAAASFAGVLSASATNEQQDAAFRALRRLTCFLATLAGSAGMGRRSIIGPTPNGLVA